jgi:molecular chaperone GrpE
MSDQGQEDGGLPAETPAPAERKPVVDETADDASEGSGSADVDDDASEASAPADDAVAPLRQTVENLQSRVTELEGRLEDHERHSEREREQLRSQAVAQFAERMLAVRDSLSNVQSLGDLDDEAQHRVDLLAKQFEKQFTAGPVDRIDTDGQFDATRHRMVERVPLSETEGGVADGDVLTEREAGYRIDDRVLRPARVVVAKADE